MLFASEPSIKRKTLIHEKLSLILKKSIDLTKKIKEKAFEEGFDAVGIAKVPGSSRIKLRTASLERWLQAGHQAQMEWMKSPRRKNVETLRITRGIQS